MAMLLSLVFADGDDIRTEKDSIRHVLLAGRGNFETAEVLVVVGAGV
jgi:hypothetical protein